MAPRRPPADELPAEPAAVVVARWLGDASRQNVHGIPARDLTTDDLAAEDVAALLADYPTLYAAPESPAPVPPAPTNEVSA